MNNPIRLALCVALAAAFAMPLQAAELAPGTVISRDNYAQHKADTFEGHTLESLLPERLQWMIQTHGMQFTLAASTKTTLDPKFLEYSARNETTVGFDPATRTVKGWEAGIPFPKVAVDDPNGGDKVAWNLILGTTYGSTMFIGTRYLFIDMKKGLERNQMFDAITTRSIGRLDGGGTDIGGGEFLRRLIYANYPNDIKGIGTFSIRYTDVAKPEDTWAYLKSVRRTRRLSGGAWMDPIAGGDQLNDDFDGWDAEPTKYQSVKLLEKRWMLAAADLPGQFVVSPDDTTQTIVNLKDAPYAMPGPGLVLQPREVYVFEATTPERHPYGKKIVYSDVQYPAVYFAEFYDRQGEFWKSYLTARKSVTGASGFKGVVPVTGAIVDYKRNHATIWLANTTIDPPEWDKTRNSLQRLEQMAK